jgi:aminoglycoside phosphotransferase (APT) family kinase protein
MPDPTDEPQFGLDLDLDRLRAYLSAAAPTLADLGPLTASRLAGGRSHLTYVISDGRHDYVLRRPPHGPLSPTAHNIAREYATLRGLGTLGVRVPPVVHLCTDPAVLGAPFMVMDRVPGRVLRDAGDVADVDPPGRRALCAELVAALVEVHSVDPQRFSPAGVGRASDFVARQVQRWTTQWHSWRTRDRPAVDALGEWLAGHLPAPRRPAVVHGDFRFDNAIFESAGYRLVALVDWELSAVGDPLTDLGMLLTYWSDARGLDAAMPHKRLTAALGVSGADIARRYAETAGADLDGLDFYVALGHFKWAVIREGVYRRQSDGAMPADSTEEIGESVGRIAEAGLEVATASGKGP